MPLVDFAKLQAGTTEKKQAATDIVDGFKNAGFIYLFNHGIPAGADYSERVCKGIYEHILSFRFPERQPQSAEFFRMPMDVKETLKWEDPRSNRGYVKIGRERSTQATDAAEIAALREKAPDFKETMEIGRDWDSSGKTSGRKRHMRPTLGLDLEEQFFDEKIREQSHNLRLLSYPPIKRALLDNEGQARSGAQSDYGTLTLLFQDQVGGLEVQNPHTGVFIPAPPIPGTIVVNVADLLARWSNDVLRSTLHRVVAPPAKPINLEEAITPARQSIAFFCNPNFSAEIACLPNCGPVAKYPPISTEAYIVGRLAATYI
ncbi:hypothetical protein K438DRAFT_1968121 [Mycena galopus ATCC 62051]|nr:hypothetical protein K438DRAFT_1968121 [Mycena galopus ATCC 62051]